MPCVYMAYFDCSRPSFSSSSPQEVFLLQHVFARSHFSFRTVLNPVSVVHMRRLRATLKSMENLTGSSEYYTEENSLSLLQQLSTANSASLKGRVFSGPPIR